MQTFSLISTPFIHKNWKLKFIELDMSIAFLPLNIDDKHLIELYQNIHFSSLSWRRNRNGNKFLTCAIKSWLNFNQLP